MTILNNILKKLDNFTKSDKHPFVEAGSFPDDIKAINWAMFNEWHYITEPYIPKSMKDKISAIKPA